MIGLLLTALLAAACCVAAQAVEQVPALHAALLCPAALEGPGSDTSHFISDIYDKIYRILVCDAQARAAGLCTGLHGSRCMACCNRCRMLR